MTIMTLPPGLRSAFELQEPSSAFYTPANLAPLLSRLDKLEIDVRAELKRQGFEGGRVHIERMLNMRFDGTDTALMVVAKGEDFESAFKKEYKTQFGFLLDTKHIIVDDIKVCCLFFLRSHTDQPFTGPRDGEDI